jgi:hypothetical protein
MPVKPLYLSGIVSAAFMEMFKRLIYPDCDTRYSGTFRISVKFTVKTNIIFVMDIVRTSGSTCKQFLVTFSDLFFGFF